jgi:outer membrane protein OmpA-like peptidoglycan-associated protein
MYTKRNNDGKDIRFCTGWEYSNSDGAPYSSPDLILATDSNDKLIRRFGLLPAHSGDCFGGFLTNEYLINTLNDPLEKDSLYLVSFWYCLPPHGFYYTQQFSYRFITEDSLFFHDPSVNAGKKKTLYNLMRNTMQDVECDSCKFRGWHKLQFYYKAKGNEAAFMFGIYSPMFPNDRKADNVELLPEGKIKLKTGEKNFGHYCYVDDFSIEKVTPPLAIGKILITRDILFASGSSTIEPKSFDYLNSLADYLLLFPDLKIEINGHTDNVGSATANQKLSEDRAEAVKNYLVSRGIISDRITTAGYGSNKLVDDNTTVEGRAQNRRIEIQISE